MNQRIMILHPGEYIKEELDTRGWIQRDLAFIIGCPEQSINLIMSGKKGISVKMAKSLGYAFNVSPELFINLQRTYDLAHVQDPDPGIIKRARIRSNYPIREMINRGWLPETKTGEELEKHLAKFFEVSDLDEIPYYAHAANKTSDLR